jgi:hypothetical protein
MLTKRKIKHMKIVCAHRTSFQAKIIYFPRFFIFSLSLLKTLFLSHHTAYSGRKPHFSKVLMWIEQKKSL